MGLELDDKTPASGRGCKEWIRGQYLVSPTMWNGKKVNVIEKHYNMQNHNSPISFYTRFSQQ